MRLVNIGNSEVRASLSDPLCRRISEVSDDCVYDTKECRKILNEKDETTYPSTKNAGLQEVHINRHGDHFYPEILLADLHEGY